MSNNLISNPTPTLHKKYARVRIQAYTGSMRRQLEYQLGKHISEARSFISRWPLETEVDADILPILERNQVQYEVLEEYEKEIPAEKPKEPAPEDTAWQKRVEEEREKQFIYSYFADKLDTFLDMDEEEQELVLNMSEEEFEAYMNERESMEG